MKQVLYPTSSFKVPEENKSVFLAGTIEQDKSENWQKEFLEFFGEGENITFFNPRRPKWDESWKQVKENKEFKDQVKWELEGLEEAQWIVMYLMPFTISPVSLIEFGMYVKSGKLLVYCPEGFYRKGNVDITSDFYGAKQFQSFEQLAEFIRNN